jgi:hypothetical protein
MAKKFRAAGWSVGKHEGDDECPKCKASRQARRRGPKLKPEPVTVINLPKDELPMAIAEQPRVATREDRRKINDALDVAYDIDRERYVGDGTDAKLAAQLNVPRAWVSEERERTFGPEANEADAKKREAAGTVLSELKALTDRCMELAQSCEDMSARVRKLLG